MEDLNHVSTATQLSSIMYQSVSRSRRWTHGIPVSHLGKETFTATVFFFLGGVPDCEIPSSLITNYTPENQHVPEKGTTSIGNTTSNH